MTTHWACLIVYLMLCPLLQAVQWQAPISVADVVERYPTEMQNLFRHLNLDTHGLEEVKVAVTAGDYQTAGEQLLRYYRNSPRLALTRPPPPSIGTVTDDIGERMLVDTFRLQFTDNRSNSSFDERVPRLPDGRLDWRFGGKDNNPRWVYLHYGVQNLYLLDAFQKTGNRTYITLLSSLLADWTVSVRYPTGEPALDGPRFADEIQDFWLWHILWGRIEVWSKLFCELQDVDEFTPAARLLLLSTIPAHVEAMTTYVPGRGHNFAMFRALSLAAISVYWPEFSCHDAIFQEACTAMNYELDAMYYPDGTYKELASSYIICGAFGHHEFLSLLRKGGTPPPIEYTTKVEQALNCLAYQLTPTGALPMRGDSDLHLLNDSFLNADDTHLAHVYKRPDWAYIASHGRQGTKPSVTSLFFPWAGQALMRSGWDEQAQWAFFDIGPSGTNHQHRDRLNLCISAYGRDLLVDAGRIDYQTPLHTWAVSSAAHNVILVDGVGQNLADTEAHKPMTDNFHIGPDFVYARGHFSAGFTDVKGAIAHTRTVIYVRHDYWLVIDQLDTDQPRVIEPLWHFHPDCTVITHEQNIITTDIGKGNLRIQPISNFSWDVHVGKGIPNTLTDHLTSVYGAVDRRPIANPIAVYRAAITGPTTFAWLITSGHGDIPDISAALQPSDHRSISIKIHLPGNLQDDITIHTPDSTAIALPTQDAGTEATCTLNIHGQPSTVISVCR